MNTVMRKSIKHPLNIAQVQRSGHSNLRVRDRAAKLEGRLKRVSPEKLTDTKISTRQSNHRIMNNDPNLNSKASALVNEAIYIGLTKRALKDMYLTIAQTNPQTYNCLKEIFKAQKQELVALYDYYLRHDKLSTLDHDEYARLYRAKYLTEPPKSLIIKLTKNENGIN
jgi:hypothetical protein